MIQLPRYYATDEDIAIRASADFALICPKDQKIASGTDGWFAAQERWTLRSNSVNFEACGLALGHVVLLTQPVGLFKPPGELFAVENVEGMSATLRRKGQAPGLGHPPAPSSGLAQVEFLVTTFDPQLSRAANDLDRRFGLCELIEGRRSCEGLDLRDIREAVVLYVLTRQYFEMSRGPEGRGDSFTAKAQSYKQELDELLGRTAVNWMMTGRPSGEGTAPGLFGARLSR